PGNRGRCSSVSARPDRSSQPASADHAQPEVNSLNCAGNREGCHDDRVAIDQNRRDGDQQVRRDEPGADNPCPGGLPTRFPPDTGIDDDSNDGEPEAQQQREIEETTHVLTPAWNG